jgi:hypothetical protein
VSKNNNNLSAAVREAIEFTNLALDNFNMDTIMNTICQEFGWQVKVSIFSMDNLNPESVTLMVSEGD